MRIVTKGPKFFFPFLVLILIGILYALPSYCLEPTVETYTANSHPLKVIYQPQYHLRASPQCFIQKGNRSDLNDKCEGIRKLKTISVQKVQRYLAGGANPGAAICTREGGRVEMALDNHFNQNTFCIFSDGSVISNGSLHYYARKNDTQK